MQDTIPVTPTEALKDASLSFVMVLSDPAATDAQVTMAAIDIGLDFWDIDVNRVRTMIDRTRQFYYKR